MSNFDDILNNTPKAPVPNTPAQGNRYDPNAEFSKEDYAAKKQAAREAAFSLSDSTALEVAGDSGRFRQFLDVQSQFDRYSAVNALLILAQKPEATRLGDYDHWNEKGGFVKAKQTAIAILEPHEYTKEDGTTGTGYNVKKVFDIAQVDTRKMNIPTPPNFTERQLLAALVHNAPMKITSVAELPGERGAMTDPDTGDITVRKGMAFADTFSSLANELTAAEVNSARAEPSIPGRMGEQYQMRTASAFGTTSPGFTAYAAAYVLCKKYGVDTQSFNLSDASAVFEGMDAQTSKGELSQIRSAAESVANRMAKHLDAVQKAAKNQDAR